MQHADDSIILNLISDVNSRNDGYKMLVNKYKVKLYNHIRYIVTNHDDTDDVLQNTFIKVFKNITSFQSQSNLYTWIYRIATNESLNLLHSNKKHHTLDIDNQWNQAVESDQPDGDQLLSILQKAIAKLPEKQRIVFNLRYFEELPYHQIAVITDTSEGALKASYHHAVKKIEGQIKQYV